MRKSDIDESVCGRGSLSAAITREGAINADASCFGRNGAPGRMNQITHILLKYIMNDILCVGLMSSRLIIFIGGKLIC